MKTVLSFGNALTSWGGIYSNKTYTDQNKQLGFGEVLKLQDKLFIEFNVTITYMTFWQY